MPAPLKNKNARKDQPLDSQLNIRCLRAELQSWKRKATEAGYSDYSKWIRDTLNQIQK